MRFSQILAVVIALCSCRTTEHPSTIGFSVTPLGEHLRATRVDNRNGDNLPAGITSATFREVTIAQGSGLDGFDAIRIFADRSGYLVFSTYRDENMKWEITLTENELAGLIGALDVDRVARIGGLYSADMSDGTQGFIEVKTIEGRRSSWLDNHFEPVANTFDYCNKVIWPKIDGAKIEKKGINRQAEYDRVFEPEKQND